MRIARSTYFLRLAPLQFAICFIFSAKSLVSLWRFRLGRSILFISRTDTPSSGIPSRSRTRDDGILPIRDVGMCFQLRHCSELGCLTSNNAGLGTQVELLMDVAATLAELTHTPATCRAYPQLSQQRSRPRMRHAAPSSMMPGNPASISTALPVPSLPATRTPHAQPPGDLSADAPSDDQRWPDPPPRHTKRVRRESLPEMAVQQMAAYPRATVCRPHPLQPATACC